MKKLFTSLALCAMLATMLPVSAFAATDSYALCSVQDCSQTGSHVHDKTTYAGHYTGDGHDYHQICTVKNCTKTGSHTHNGVECLPHSSGDGHTYHNSGSHKGESHGSKGGKSGGHH
ncbi:hypothetical protein [Hydrogenoanaerobacterium sp.]|uniref:hypothetical protein n=1 Tax=Hydrogenoanaerobacterium sp. TaxID=2953763 RepID=UPI0028A12884|nr:hypothetical protein [Hydrogenoanaerobacterium sp.]